MPQGLCDNKSTMVQVKNWCRQAIGRINIDQVLWRSMVLLVNNGLICVFEMRFC